MTNDPRISSIDLRDAVAAVPWADISARPGAPRAIRDRQDVLDRVLSGRATDRLEVILGAAVERRVLDIGCVDHHEDLVDSDHWLHAKIAAVASSCVGVDTHSEGIGRMRERGYEACVADVVEDAPLALQDAPFDLVIAGELIEHLEAPIALLRFASQVLKPGGRLILTSPNPFAPWRARAGQLGIAWENCDHLSYIFPSGMIEMAARTGFLVEQISTENEFDNSRSVACWAISLAKGLARRLLARQGDQPAKSRLKIPLPRTWLSPSEFLLFRMRSHLGQSRERVIYQLVYGGDLAE